MDPIISVLYKGSLAHFAVTMLRTEIFTVHLLKYQGHIVNEPPHEFTLNKEGRHWHNQSINQDLLDDIGLAIEAMKTKYT